jgi:hypothetical protein
MTHSKSNVAILAFILIGVLLRVAWIEDMEWHFDAHWMFEKSQEIWRTGKWPLLGMENGARFQNPGLSIWVFALMGYFAKTPVGMTGLVVILNLLAILFFLLFTVKNFEGKERDIWLKGIALGCVGPLTILWSRKIWAQDILPIFSFLIIYGHFYRSRRDGAFLWGMVGAMIGQIHMSGFFYSFALFLFSLIHDRVNKRSTRWGFWFFGSVVGSIGLLPWLDYLLNNSIGHKREWKYIFQFRFFTYWLMESLGIHLKYNLKHAFSAFLQLPRVGGTPLYLIGLVHSFLWGVGAYLLYLMGKYAKAYDFSKVKNFKFLKGISLTHFYLCTFLLGMGMILTLSSVKLYPHYLIILFPFVHIWTAQMLHSRPALFWGVACAQLILSLSFFGKVHMNQVIPGSHYGKTYKQKCIVEKREKCQLDWMD